MDNVAHSNRSRKARLRSGLIPVMDQMARDQGSLKGPFFVPAS